MAVPTPVTATSTACAPGDIVVGLRTLSGGRTAGSQCELLTFRDTFTTTCTLNGHSGVSFVGRGNGTQLGEPAGRTGPVRADHLRWPAGHPLNWRVSMFVPFRAQLCQLDPGTSPQLTVSAVGSM